MQRKVALENEQFLNLIVNDEITIVITKNDQGYVIDMKDMKDNLLSTDTLWEEDYIVE